MTYQDKRSPNSPLGKTAKTTTDTLIAVGRSRGLDVTAHATMMVGQAGIRFAGGTLRDVELAGAEQLAEGIDFGFFMFEAASGALPSGDYLLRLTAESPKAIGEIDGKAQLIDSDGKVVAEAEGVLEIDALKVDPGETARAMLMARVDFAEELSPGVTTSASLVLGVWCKKNGMHGDGFTFATEATGA